MKKLGSVFAAHALVLAIAAPAYAYEVDSDYDSERTALAVVHTDGRWSGSPDALEPRSALSLSKLFLGYWVLYNGTEKDKELVEEMIAVSHDGYAQELDSKYPQAINEVAEDFHLQETVRNGAWGRTSTSAFDVAKFVSSILWDPVAEPLLNGMRDKPAIARDGFSQLFGTAKLEHTEGTKSGWSDDGKSETGSVSFGTIGDDVWVASALTIGDAESNTADVEEGIIQIDDLVAEDLRKFRAHKRRWEPGQRLPIELTQLALPRT